MDRRDLIRTLGLGAATTALAGLSPGRLLALGRDAHEHATTATWRRFSPHQGELAGTIAELIIPSTDTPGAREAGVAEFMDFMVESSFDPDDRDRFLLGLDEMDRRSMRLNGLPFLQTSHAQQNAVLTGMATEAESLREAGEEDPPHFFHVIKELTLFGYYTSEIGMTEELGWRMIPGSYDGCVDLAQPRPGGF
jgi:hypothetical protein